MPDLLPALNSVLVFAASFLVTFVSTPIIGRILKSHGINGKDVHKLEDKRLPEMCGLAILLGLTVGVATFVYIFPNATREAVAFIGTVLIAGTIGIVDDLRPLSAKLKPLLTAIACVPILLLGTYDPIPVIPFVGPVRLTIVYPLLIPIALAVTSNAVNMMDVMNGAMAGTASVIAAVVVAILVIAGRTDTASLAAGLLAVCLAFYYFNRYPAKVFDGDTGSLAVGAALGAIAILGRIEVVVVVALIPHIMNAFYGLSSVGRLYERREISQRPIVLMKNGELQASTDRNAPVTLVRLILAAAPWGEKNISRAMIILTLVSSLLAVVTFGLTLVGRI